MFFDFESCEHCDRRMHLNAADVLSPYPVTCPHCDKEQLANAFMQEGAMYALAIAVESLSEELEAIKRSLNPNNELQRGTTRAPMPTLPVGTDNRH